MRKEVSRTKNAESRDTSRKEQKSAKSTSGVGYSSYITTQPIQPIQFAKKNETGLPDKLKAGVENLSGYRMDDVKVHYNSDKPAKVNAYAYTQGTDIHVAPGQERHLPHEAWHVVQQKEGRVKPTLQLKGIQVNDDKGLEHEADVMGAKAFSMPSYGRNIITEDRNSLLQRVVQRLKKGNVVIQRGRHAGGTVIVNTEKGVLYEKQYHEHVESRHGAGSSFKGKSKFSTNISIKEKIQETLEHGTESANTFGRAGKRYEYTFPDEVGIDQKGNKVNSVRVVVDKDGEVITAFPV